MVRRLAGYAARLDRLEATYDAHRMHFRTAKGRTFSLDVADVMSIVMDCLTWLHDETADQPRGRIVEQLATAELDAEQGLIGHTAIAAARHIIEGVRP